MSAAEEQELAAAIEAMLDASDARLEQVYAMNRRVKAELGQVLGVLRLALEDGARDVMRDAIDEVITDLSSLIDDQDTGSDVPRLTVKWAGKA